MAALSAPARRLTVRHGPVALTLNGYTPSGARACRPKVSPRVRRARGRREPDSASQTPACPSMMMWSQSARVPAATIRAPSSQECRCADLASSARVALGRAARAMLPSTASATASASMFGRVRSHCPRPNSSTARRLCSHGRARQALWRRRAACSDPIVRAMRAIARAACSRVSGVAPSRSRIISSRRAFPVICPRAPA